MSTLTSDRGKAIAIRLAEDGYDVCINDVPANQAGIDEVSPAVYLPPTLLHLANTPSANRQSKKSSP